MKSLTGFLLLITALAVPVHAGQGTIEETETAIIVEYTGDASDRPVDKAKPETIAEVQKTQTVELQTATTEATTPENVKQRISVREAKANRSEAQRQKQEKQAASRAMRPSSRQTQGEPE